MRDLVIGDIAGTLWILMGTIGILLLIACANVANLLLVRAESRQHELAVRAALGASWRDLARELLTESAALGLLGGVLGLGFAYAAIRVLVALAPANLPRLHDIAIDPAVVVFNFAVALATGILFGLIPVLKYAGPRIAYALRAGRGASQSREHHRARNVLVVSQVALALVLLIGSGLMIRTFQALRRVDPGFDAHDALTLRLTIPLAQVKDPVAVVKMQQALLDKLHAIPGVSAVGASNVIPTEPGGSDLVYAHDKQYAKGVPPLRRYKIVSPGLLTAMGHRLVAGRDFTWTDTLEHRPVAMVSENLARELWQNPRLAIGKEIRETLASPWREVIGVIADVRDDGVASAAPAAAYYPLLMNDFQAVPAAFRRTLTFVVRSPRVGSDGFLADVQRAVWSVNAGLPVANVRTLQEILGKSLARTSFTLVMLGIAGGMALLIGLVGIYGVISYTVTQRTREIGIRIALGARPSELTRMFLGQAVVLAAVGVGCGLGCAAALTRLLGSLLFGVSPVDPLTYAAVSVVLVGACALASYVPALRAASVDPLESLRM
jgi:predicted permease